MANHESAAKRARQNENQRQRNRQNISSMKTAIKRVQQAVSAKQEEMVPELMRKAQSVIAKTRKKGAIHRNQMARRISRLAQHVNSFLEVPGNQD